MIEEIRIRSLGVIRDARLPLGPGLTVITGETGAGKTMVVTGLGLLMGERADAGAVRAGDDAAVVEGRVLVPEDGAAAARAREAGGDVDDGELLLVRTLAATGRSRAHVGGRSAPVGVLAEISEHLVAVHGQTDQLRLRSGVQQLRVLDAFAGAVVATDLAQYQELHARWRAVAAEHDRVAGSTAERAREAELLRLGLDEVERVDPQPDEDVALREESDRLAHVEVLRAAVATAHEALTGEVAGGDGVGEGGADARVDSARRALAQAGDHDPALTGFAARAGEISYLLADLATEVAAYAQSLEADPLRLSVVQERRAQLTALVRRHAADPADGVAGVLRWAREAAERLLDLDDDGRVKALAEERDDLEVRLRALAQRLSAARRSAAADLEQRVAAELTALAMPSARIEVAVHTGHDLGPWGCDGVELLLAAHSGAVARPLSRGASGGELSRVMLALEVVLAGADPVPTMVFDEVDAGVGGRAAVEIGRRLARLARTTQVVVVTHLAQVAAFADRHLTVVKTDDGSVTESGVVRLEDEGRIEELARMLSGRGSGTARAHAEELLRSSRAEAVQGDGTGPAGARRTARAAQGGAARVGRSGKASRTTGGRRAQG
ncbi:DNA repair protein RecN (Recombination protein N) [Kineococcus radiotolerans]|uniref:DNA repair protein RecN n=1 Tax=Kineococcus radiotolerans TaxID=131568 RepID=A0A7W4XYX6_KINRA|nr:DNA repair protein RecN [Kineococcus radiotolerans]MBB2902715.1 DNA repair protein RecN (Recombination protein N) [Kineococcus radiotolerans]